MPRTREELEVASAAAERWLDELDPDVMADPQNSAGDLRAISSALSEVASGEGRLADAVSRARDNGRSWGEIGIILGISKQAARVRYDKAHAR